MQTVIISNAAFERALKLTRTIPAQATNVRFSIQVPGGGDYSNINLTIGQGGDDVPLQVHFDMAVMPCHACSIHAARLASYAKPVETGPIAPGLR